MKLDKANIEINVNSVLIFLKIRFDDQTRISLFESIGRRKSRTHCRDDNLPGDGSCWIVFSWVVS